MPCDDTANKIKRRAYVGAAGRVGAPTGTCMHTMGGIPFQPPASSSVSFLFVVVVALEIKRKGATFNGFDSHPKRTVTGRGGHAYYVDIILSLIHI